MNTHRGPELQFPVMYWDVFKKSTLAGRGLSSMAHPMSFLAAIMSRIAA